MADATAPVSYPWLPFYHIHFSFILQPHILAGHLLYRHVQIDPCLRSIHTPCRPFQHLDIHWNMLNSLFSLNQADWAFCNDLQTVPSPAMLFLIHRLCMFGRSSKRMNYEQLNMVTVRYSSSFKAGTLPSPGVRSHEQMNEKPCTAVGGRSAKRSAMAVPLRYVSDLERNRNGRRKHLRVVVAHHNHPSSSPGCAHVRYGTVRSDGAVLTACVGEESVYL
ncbi:hypothetical protein OF83DRAFT_819111 [Amylostereum chailletii]|nr:hypothetical protein OF83DRAFT_819111 [Amylostereum chailletii]